MEASRDSRAPAPASLAGAVQRVGGRVGRRLAVWSLTVVLAGLAGAILAAGVALSASPLAVPIVAAPLVAMLFLFSEWFPVHLRVRRETHTFSLTEIPLLIGLFFLSPLTIVLAQALGAGVALVVRRRQSVMRLAFNLANFAWSTTCAAGVFHALLGSQDPLGPVGLVAAYAAAFTADQLSGLGVALAIWTSGGDRPKFLEHVGLGAAYTFVDASMALVAVIVLSSHPEEVWLLAVPILTTLIGLRLYHAERLKRESLGSLQESTRQLQVVLDTADVTPLLLRQVRDMFGVRVAALAVFQGGPLRAGVTTLDLDDVLTSADATRLDGHGAVDELVGPQPGGMIVHHPADGTSLRWLQGDGPGEAMVAPLRDGDVVRGVLVAGDRLANAGPFHADDLSLFETLANHAAVAMKNNYLIDRLRAEAQLNDHQARHDALTQLPNRTLFQERLDAALAAGSRHCAVLLLDIDRFKEVNDTLGHHNGDRLLVQMAARLVDSVGRDALVARLSGDEFAVLIGQPETDQGSIEDRAVEAAGKIRASLATPFPIEGLALVITASIGISFSPDHGSTADGLIRRADVAMYNAKGDRDSGFEVYRAERDGYSAARLALVGDLRTAVEGDQIEVVYQMQVDAASGEVEGAEALARWRHPARGVLLPSEFIGLAEHAGLMRPLTERVLRLAVRDAAAWRQRWPSLRVSVNLSPRTLLDPTLPPMIRQVLLEHGLPPSVLTLEVTESAIVDNARRVEEALLDLTTLGCSIAIDDFGTGYSSFSYLRRLSIHELKIDRSFVHGMATDASDRAIVELTIDLGHRLGKRVVAEGVETDQEAERLARIGCDSLQGYLLSRPVSNEAFTEAVEARMAGMSRASVPVPSVSAAEPGVPPLPHLRRLDTVPTLGPRLRRRAG